MKNKVRMLIGFVALGMWLIATNLVGAQERAAAVAEQRETRVAPRAAAYDATREVVIQGIVASYSETSTSHPIGAHVAVQTAMGTIDVHLGPSSYLRANHFSLAPGDSVRFIGAVSSTGKSTVLLARIAQKGSQALAIRSTQGFLLTTGATRAFPKEQREQAAQKESAR